MKLQLIGHDERYVVEQSLMALFPGELPEYAPIAPEDTDWAARSRPFTGRRPPGRAAGISVSTRTCAIPARGGCTIRSGIKRSASRRARSTV